MSTAESSIFLFGVAAGTLVTALLAAVCHFIDWRLQVRRNKIVYIKTRI